MDAVPFALVGCGLMGARHLRGHAELERTAPGSFRLVAVCDRDQAMAEAVATEAEQLLGYRPAVVNDLAGVAAAGAIAADVVTPNRTHDAVVCELLEAGVHVQCEKPFAVTIARGRKMIETARATGKTLAVAENNRRDPMNRLLRHAVQRGLLGKLNFVLQTSVGLGGGVVGTPWRHKRSMGGIALDVWIHLGYMLEYLAGPIATVSAEARLVQPTRTMPDGSTIDAEAPDALAAMLTFEDGAIGTWSTHLASTGWTGHQRTLFGDLATAASPGDRSGQPVRIQRGKETLEGETLLAELPDYALPAIETKLFGERPTSYQLEGPVTDRKLIAAEVADFLTAVATGAQPEVPGETGLRSVAIIHAMLESAAAGRPVAVEDVLSGQVDAVQREMEVA